VPGLRATIQALDPTLAVGRTQALEEVVSDSLRSRRFVLVLVAVFGGASLALAGIGLFGVMAYLVAQRTSELGVRLALAALLAPAWRAAATSPARAMRVE
jgi:ABC-type antimicrobial peptide transport system permease subunit